MRAPRARSWAAACLAVVAVLLPAATPAWADGFTPMPSMPIGIGSTAIFRGLPAGVALPGFGGDMAASTYSLSQVDPVNQAMTMGALGQQLTADYTVTNDLASSDLAAINAADLARQARLEEEARRAALAAGATVKGLKPGSVPAQYEPLVLDAVARYCPQLSPGILAAQLEAESGWNPQARSKVGALGIAQFMPSTWASHGIDGNGDGTKDVWDPADAIPAAAAYDCAVRDAVRNVPGDLDANMLAAYNSGPGAVIKYGGVPPYSETQQYVSKILARADQITTYTGGSAGAAGTAAGCPVTAPAGTLRDAATQYSIEQICADSVAQARSPEAARAIKFALRNLGAPYSQANRMAPHEFDCSSYVMRAYQAAGVNVIPGGWAPTTYTMVNAPWAHSIPFDQARPGDLVLPFPGHVAMVLAHGLKVHTNMPGDVSHVNDLYTSAWRTLAIDPSAA